MSNTKFTRWGGVAVFVLVGTCTLFAGSSSLPVAEAAQQDGRSGPNGNSKQKPRTAAGLEKLHANAVNRSKTDEDDRAVKLAKNPALTDVSPERAAQLALVAAGGGRLTWVSRHTGNDGKPYYHVRIDRGLPSTALGKKLPEARLHVDVGSGNVTDGSQDNLNDQADQAAGGHR